MEAKAPIYQKEVRSIYLGDNSGGIFDFILKMFILPDNQKINP